MSLFGLGKRGEQLAKGIIELINESVPAKQYIQQGTNPENLVAQGLLAPEQIDNIRAVQGAQNRYLKHSLESPEFLRRELGYQSSPTVTTQIPQPPRNIIMPEDLEGMAIKSHLGDRTVTDKSIESIGGVDLPVPVQSRGGVGYGSSPLTPTANYWGSNLSAAQSLQNAAEGIEGLLDMPVVGAYSAMGREGNFFNQAFADALQQQVNAIDLPQEAIDHFDNAMRTLHGRKDWVGLRHPDARKQLLGTDGYPQKGAGKLRSAYVQQMDKAAYKNQGFPLLQPLMKEFIEPDLANVNVGDSGYIMGQIGKDFGLSPTANHPSYDTGIMGRVIGGFPVSVPSRVMYPDAYKILDKAKTTAGENYTAAQMINALAVRHDMYQIATPKWVDSVSEWIRKNPKGSAKALMMAVGMPIALGSSEQVDAAIIPKLAKTTQRANTVPTAKAADAYLEKQGAKGRSIDYGAGFGINAKAIDYDDTFEPFAEEGFTPTYANSADIPENTYGKLVSTNVLNVIPPDLRDDAVLSIGKILEPNGMAVIQTRSASAVNELKKSKTAIPQDEPASFLTSKGSYQKGFTRDELQGYVQGLLGDNFDVQKVPAKDIPNGSAISVKKLSQAAPLVVGGGLLAGEDAEAAIVPSALRSIALDAMADVPRKKPTSYTGWKKALNKAGIKDDELKQMGFKREFEFRQRAQDITRKEVEDFLADNQYNIREETLGQTKSYGEVVYDPELNTYNAEMPFISDNETFHTREAAEAYVARNPEIMTDYQYGPYTLTGAEGNNYREILLMDGPEADKYEALTDEMLRLENEITDGMGAPRGYLSRDVLMEFEDGTEFKKQFDRLQEVRAERNRLAQPFIHRHYDDKENILTHLRVADRDLEDGSSTLMVEEIQSDLHQRGQEYGYAKPNALEDITKQINEVNDQINALKQSSVTQWAEKNMPEVYKRAYGFDGDLTADQFLALRKKMENAFEEDYKKRTGKDRNAEFERLADLKDSLKERRLKTMNAAPDMPFKSDDKSSWYDLAFKRSLMEAAEGDYDSISFTTGQQQVDRYGESAEGGVKKFYDVTLPNHINKWAKQYGVKLERKPIRVGEKDYSIEQYDDETYFVRDEEGNHIEDFDMYSEAENYIKNQVDVQDVYTLKIPEKMRKDIREKGMPLFAQTGLTIGGATAASGLLSPKAQAQEESKARKEMTRKERRDTPPSQNLLDYATDRSRRAVGEMGLGLLQGIGEGADFFKPANLAAMYFGLPQVSTTGQDIMKPLTDKSFLEEDEGKQAARLIGSLLSPI